MACAPAFAAFEEIYMVGGLGDTNPQTNFGWDDTPWLYLKLPDPAPATVGSWWYNPSFFPYQGFEVVCPQTTATDRWLAISNWEDVKAMGDWTVYGMHWYEAGTYTPSFDSKSTTFTVTPEPLGCSLFALGGLSLAFLRWKRNKVRA